MEIIKETDYPLLGRKEYLVKCVFDKIKTPSNNEIKKSSASLLKTSEDLVVVKKIKQQFGLNQAVCDIYVYKDASALDKIEKIKKKPKKKAEEAVPQAPKK